MKGPDCLTPSQLEAMMTGLETEAAKTHVAACTHCQTELALMRQFIEGEPSAEEVAAVRQIERRLRTAPAPWRPQPTEKASGGIREWWAGLFTRPAMSLATVAAVAALAIGVWLGNPGRPVAEPIDPGITRSLSVEGVEPVGDLDRAPSSLHWQALPGAASYEVAVLDVEEKAIWTARTTGAELALPDEARALMADRKTLFWRVRAFDTHGRALALGAPQQFRVVLPH